MRTVRLLIAFQGTHYLGWQSQKNGRTIQEIFEACLVKIFKEKINIHGSSRTDAGAHAQGYVAHFRTKNRLADAKIKNALNHFLPDCIVVLSARTAPDSFHARFSAKSKTYQYQIWDRRTRPAYDKAPFVLWVPQRLDIRAMQKAGRFFVGRHDFSALRDRGDEDKGGVRNIKSLTVTRKGSLVTIRVTADGFLKHMVRIIAGTLIQVGRGKLFINDTITLLESKDRKKSGPTAKSHGLTLIKVRY